MDPPWRITTINLAMDHFLSASMYTFFEKTLTLVGYPVSFFISYVYLLRRYGVPGPVLYSFGNAKIWNMQRRFLMTREHDVAEKLRKMLQEESNILSVAVRTPIVRLSLRLPRLLEVRINIDTELTWY